MKQKKIIQFDIYGNEKEVKENQFIYSLGASLNGFNGGHKDQFKTTKEFLIAYTQFLNKMENRNYSKFHFLKEELRKNLPFATKCVNGFLERQKKRML